MIYKQYEPDVLKKLQNTELEVAKEIIRICEKYNISYFALYGTALGTVRHQGFIPWDDDMDFGMLREDYEKFISVAEAEFQGKYKLAGPETKEPFYNLVPNVNKVGTRYATIFDHGNYHTGILVDIFVFDYTSTNNQERKKQIKRCMFWRNLYLLRNVNFWVSPIEGSGNQIIFAASACIHYLLKFLHISPDWIYKKYKREATKYNHIKTKAVTCFDGLLAEKTYMEVDDIYPLHKMKYEDTEINMVANYDKMLTRCYGNYMQLPKKENRQNHYPYILDFGE